VRCLLAIALTLLCVPGGNSKCDGLMAWYDSYNERYFRNFLPKDTVVVYGDTEKLAPNSMGATFKDGLRFHILLNPFYTTAPVVAHETLLHEMCHIETWNVHDSLDGHGKAWRSCMNRLYKEGAMEGLL